MSSPEQSAPHNARTHGLTAAHPLVRPGDEPDFDALSESLRQSLRPAGVLEELLFGRIVLSSWNLQRVDRLEIDLITGDIDPLLNGFCAPAMDRLIRYRAMTERSLFRGLKEFRTQQTMRAERALLPQDQEQTLPPQARPSVLAAPRPARGFVSQFRSENLEEPRNVDAEIPDPAYTGRAISVV